MTECNDLRIIIINSCGGDGDEGGSNGGGDGGGSGSGSGGGDYGGGDGGGGDDVYPSIITSIS